MINTDRETPAVAVGSVFNDAEIIEQHLYPSLDSLGLSFQRLVLDNTHNVVTTNIASLYNAMLRLAGPDLMAFLHPDISFHAQFFDDLFAAAAHLENTDRPWGALGIVGRSWSGRYVWCHDVQEPTPVCALDSCSLITTRSCGLTFDQKRFNEFHCYVEDYCLQCHAKGLGVYVFPTRARHGSVTMRDRGSAWGNYRKYYWILRLKWWRKFRNFYVC